MLILLSRDHLIIVHANPIKIHKYNAMLCVLLSLVPDAMYMDKSNCDCFYHTHICVSMCIVSMSILSVCPHVCVCAHTRTLASLYVYV